MALFWYNPRRFLGTIVFRRKQTSSGTKCSVQEDWVALLPRDKHSLYETVVRDWEGAYGVLSVALNEALSQRAQGELVKAREYVEIAGAVVNRLTEPLIGAYRALQIRSRQLPVPPSVSPLNPAFFRGEVAKRNAAWNQLLHRILFGSRSKYLHKLRVLETTLSTVADHFQETAEGIADGVDVRPQEAWSALDTLHYDLNTCLRETVVMLKCFLRALPDAGLEVFRKELIASASVSRARARTRARAVAGFHLDV